MWVIGESLLHLLAVLLDVLKNLTSSTAEVEVVVLHFFKRSLPVATSASKPLNDNTKVGFWR